MIMKAIIIDDERHVREGLKLLGDWEVHGIDTILEAEDGEEAIELIKEHRPEIIFTDMRMPRRDGISLLKWLHSCELRSKTIVVSGHDDYEYMRNALYYKSFDYILKPIEPEVLNDVLRKAVEEWNEQALSRKNQVKESQVLNEVKPLYWDRVFSRLCQSGELPAAAENRIKSEYGQCLQDIGKKIALIPIRPLAMKAFQCEEELAFFTLSNIANELLSKNNEGVCFRNITNEEELVVLIWNEQNAPLLLSDICMAIYQYCKIQPIVALGSSSVSMKEAYSSSHHILRKHDLLSSKKVVTSKEVTSRSLLHLLDYSNELKWGLQSGSVEEVQSQVRRLLELLEEKYVFSLEQIDSWDTQFLLLKNNWIKEYEINENTPIIKKMDYWKEDGSFSLEKFKKEKAEDFRELVMLLSCAKYLKEKNSIQKIEEYLRNHYQEDITLQQISERFYLSREYISRKFKQDYDATITDYLTGIRMEKAKKLLENSYLKIYEIAYEVGYQNEKYFSKVFKKHEGITPNDYRQSISAKS
ncbi:response regulator [Bacillus salacetis]|uniref:Response regulator n=1 Tax=Bacillus salacetis TaxID=2315464 RepID=A0A3A1QTG2_9BACI|nr:response regulator [Bacillus salacetis]RIW29577.1 response regulator [Bacillus salacetis]